MPRAPRMTKAGLRQSDRITDSVTGLLSVLQERHPNSPALTAAARLVRDFWTELGQAEERLDKADTADLLPPDVDTVTVTK
jgi:hypothetical protein